MMEVDISLALLGVALLAWGAWLFANRSKKQKTTNEINTEIRETLKRMKSKCK